MKTRTLLALGAVLMSVQLAGAQGTGFTYQGRLNDGTNPANGRYDFQFQVFDAFSGGSSLGSPNPNSLMDVAVSDGLFTVVLDFGSGVFDGADRWLQVLTQKTGGGSFVAISPRQKLTPTPYAIYAGNAAQVGGQAPTAFVAKAGDTMTGKLNLPVDGLTVGGGQLFASGGNWAVTGNLNVDGAGTNNGALVPGVTFGAASFEGISSKRTSGGNHFGLDFYTGARNRMSIANGGNVGIGTTNPASKLVVVGDFDVDATPLNATFAKMVMHGGGPISFLGNANDRTLYLGRNGVPDVTVQTGTGNVGVGTTTPQAKLDVAGSLYCQDASVCALTIRGGCDLAEPFQMSHGDIPKGSVVVIDEENPGKLRLADQAYDTRVAGIISGANGINAGISLHQEGVIEGGQNVALSGRVYVLADAANGAIKPGDLLTSSRTPGHVMRVTDHSKAQGAIVGKAMSALKEGKGIVLVLVGLQ